MFTGGYGKYVLKENTICTCITPYSMNSIRFLLLKTSASSQPRQSYVKVQRFDIVACKCYIY